jgi:hypothetical protein
MSTQKSLKVPKDMDAIFGAIAKITDGVCREHLNEEYAELARYAVAALSRKRPSPLTRGQRETWACAVVYALGQVNFLSDSASEPYMSMADLCAKFGVAPSTAGNKAKMVRDLLGFTQFDPHWTVPSMLDQNPLVWLIEVNGFAVDVRHLPREIQEAAYREGLIPYIPADRG